MPGLGLRTCSAIADGCWARMPMARCLPAAPKDVNHNVLLTAVAHGAGGVSQGIWLHATLATFVFVISDNSSLVRVSGAPLLAA